VQAPEGGHVSSQLPEEQSIVHGAEEHEPVQLPDEHGHAPPEHDTPERGAPVPGSEMGGPPFGLPPPPPPPELPHAMTRKDDSAKQAK
jgi:hypothetical protein